MTHFDADFDYLLLLGIEPAEVAKNPAGLADRIKAKKKEWMGQAHNPLYQQAARANLERAREFEAILGEPEALEAYVVGLHQHRAAHRAEQKAATALTVASAAAGKYEITAKQRDIIAKDLKSNGVPDGLLDEVLKERNYKIILNRQAAPAEPPKLPLRTPALDRVILADIQNWLKVVGKGSLYELLDLPHGSPPRRLVSTAQTMFLYWSKKLPKTNYTTAMEKTIQAATTYLKDVESKERYDNGLFNQRVQRFAKMIDLVLAGPAFGPEEQGHLFRVGIEEYGFTESLIDQCLAARMAEKGIPTASKVTVAVRIDGQVRCHRCGIWNVPKSPRCRECGGSMHRKCENPACRGGPLPIDAKVCPSCSLPVARGTQYRTLLRLADTFIETGSHAAAISVCQLAEQILPGDAVRERLERSVKVRELAATARQYAAAKAWNAVREVLRQLNALAPRQSISGVPSLEKIAAYQATWREKIQSAASDAAVIDSAKAYLACLRQWSDCDEAHQRLRLQVNRLESDRRPRVAWQLALKLLEIRPGDEELRAQACRLEDEVRRVDAQQNERRLALNEYVTAVREDRLYAAERALHEIEQSSVEGPSPPQAEEVRGRLAEVRAELGEIRDNAVSQLKRDLVITRYLDLLRRCRDCREALLALQTAPLDPLDPPEQASVRLEGNRRVLSWKPPSSGKKPTSYIVQRSLTRPGSRQVDAPFSTVFEGDSLHYSDDEIAHCGAILRYMVHAVHRGRIELEGSTIRTFELVSRPVAFPGVLVWQEVLSLRCTRKERALELTWHQPSGARQVLIERWPGGPGDRGLGVTILPATGEGRLLDTDLIEGLVFTYRVLCVYDGPEGEFRSPGVCLTDGISPHPKGPANNVVATFDPTALGQPEPSEPSTSATSSLSE